MFDEFDDTEIHMNEDDSSSDEDAPRQMGIGKVSYFVTIRVFLGGNQQDYGGYLSFTGKFSYLIVPTYDI